VSHTIYVRANGPLILKGNIIVIKDVDNNILLKHSEAFLCRCGQSKNKPFCDGAHKQSGFIDDAVFKDEKSEKLNNDSSKVSELLITVRDNAMLIAKGPMTIQSEDMESITTRNKAALCRCGISENKPFCDASHKAGGCC